MKTPSPTSHPARTGAHEGFQFRVVAPGVTLDRVVGVIDDELARTIAAVHDEAFDLGSRPHTFHDWSEVTGYSPFARKYLTDWLRGASPRLRSVHILFSSRLLAMGISVANGVLGGLIRAHGDAASFQAALAEALREE
jgi:hypothetical protein